MNMPENDRNKQRHTCLFQFISARGCFFVHAVYLPFLKRKIDGGMNAGAELFIFHKLGFRAAGPV
jgi:hypothetical protein